MFGELKHVVVGANDSATARQAVDAAAELSKLAGATLHVVTADSAHQGSSPAVLHTLDDARPAGDLLEDLAGIAKKHGLEPVLHQSADAPADAVVNVAGEVGAELIVVGNKGMKGVRRVLGSIPNSVAHNAPCSVLIVDTTGAD